MYRNQFKYAAGMLIFARKGNKTFVLLGEDHYGTHSDFGGRCESTDMNEAETASRECYEETCGVLDSYANLKKKCFEAVTIRSETFYKRPYYTFICFVLLDESIPVYFERAKNIINHKKDLKSFNEKTRLRWILWSDVIKGNIPLRNMFKATIQNNKQNIEDTLKVALFNRNT